MAKPLQLKLRLMDGVYYECTNQDCFYLGVLLDYSEVVWKYQWHSDVQDLMLTPFCPSCAGLIFKEHLELEADYETDKDASETESDYKKD